MGLVVVGLLLAAGVSLDRAREAAGGRVRQTLIERIDERTRAADQRADSNEQLRGELARARAGALASTGDAGSTQLAGRLAALDLAAGVAAVQGPGVLVTLDDAAGARTAARAPRDGGARPVDDAGRVLDRDLQVLTNDLWAAGAEAVAVGDQRPGAGTAIRAAGEAVLVGYRPLVPPYEVRAVGDPARLEATLRDGVAGRRLSLLADRHGVRFAVRREEHLHLPAAAVVPFRSVVVEPATGTGGSPS